MCIKISIIVTCHDRKNYLMTALESIKNQTVGIDQYEVIVAKNFYEPEIDKYIEQNCFTNLYCGGSLANKILKSIELCNGEIITFLEDDDIYNKDRIKTLIDQFKKFPNITFYHNSTLEINEYGEKIKRNHHPQVRKSVLTESKNLENLLAYLVSKNADFNNGSIAIRKKILLNNLDVYKNATDISSSFTDMLYFLFSLNSNGLIFIDSKVMTNVRRHDSASVKISGGTSTFIEFQQKFNNDLLKVVQYLTHAMQFNKTAGKYITIKEARAELEKSILSSTSRLGLVHKFKKYLKSIKIPHGKYEILLSISFIISLFSKNVGKKFLNQILHVT